MTTSVCLSVCLSPVEVATVCVVATAAYQWIAGDRRTSITDCPIGDTDHGKWFLFDSPTYIY